MANPTKRVKQLRRPPTGTVMTSDGIDVSASMHEQIVILQQPLGGGVWAAIDAAGTALVVHFRAWK